MLFSPIQPAGVSDEAMELLRTSECIDLHLDGFIWHRILGYDLTKFHSKPPLGGHLGGHLDLPRAAMYGLSAGGWSITTNPFRTAKGRWQAFQRNLDALVSHLTTTGTGFPAAIATDAASYRRHRLVYSELARENAEDSDDFEASTTHVVLPAIQGANALEAAPDGVASIPDDLITRITLVHLTNNCYGVSSVPLPGPRAREGLTAKGKTLVEQMDERRIFVDLAHINEAGFWDAVAVHDPSLPLICTHTGVDGVCPHWRNLDDRQIKAIADTGGVIGVIFEVSFLRKAGGPADGRIVIDHLQHIIDVAGEDFAALGSDYDGMISPPHGLRSPAYVQLVQWMLERGWSDTRIRKILGDNFLRAFTAIRPGNPDVE